ncbi:MAG: tRNA (adenosine(37)-N6)-threonylcarbamoyltransferase complex dimerization subunit type 1 TsaB, partial [Paracoccaceae bacterium]|nr:tRNA (adenosine(37)-N6)-threonylcarbamoyltransferase complex dimerization subunit type 1 TsaB [Paracoccaceae bacterium]
MTPEAIVLGFDTSAAHCAAALLRGDAVLAHRFEPMAKGQAERLMPMIEEQLAEAGLGFADLAVIGVGVGPGNFTGIRVAVAAARGLALALGIPAVGVSATEAAACDLPRPCRVVLEGRGGALIWEDFPDDPDEASRGSRPQ